MGTEDPLNVFRDLRRACRTESPEACHKPSPPHRHQCSAHRMLLMHRNTSYKTLFMASPTSSAIEGGVEGMCKWVNPMILCFTWSLRAISFVGSKLPVLHVGQIS